MSYTFTAVNCPAVQVPGTVIYKGNTGQSPPTSIQFSTGAFTNVPANLNSNSKGADMAQRYGSGGYGVGSGLALSAGTGLICAVAQGQAVCDGLVEVYTAQNVVVSASSNNWIWLKQDGTLVVTTTTAKPTGNVVLLGCAITSGSAVTSVDYSGVVYWRGGQMWRETADVGKPLDTPDSTLRFWTKTAGGLYFWDGLAYRYLQSMNVQSLTTTAAVLTTDSIVVLADATAGAITLTLPPAASFAGQAKTVKRMNSGANAVIVDGLASETIDGSATVTLSAQYQVCQIISNGTNWVRIV
jgi:hypothetical protein